MNDLQSLSLMAENFYHQDKSLVEDVKIVIGLTKNVGGQMIVHFCGKKENAIKHAKDFAMKYKKECYIFDFCDYKTKEKVKYTKVDFVQPAKN
jgi:CheY-specific phosphatase CheX